jgi:hypothetical protein
MASSWRQKTSALDEAAPATWAPHVRLADDPATSPALRAALRRWRSPSAPAPTLPASVLVATSPVDPEAMWRALGWLGRMTQAPCLLEAFSQAVPEEEALSCLRKQLNLQHEQTLEAAAQRPEGTPRPKLARLPLWLL